MQYGKLIKEVTIDGHRKDEAVALYCVFNPQYVHDMETYDMEVLRSVVIMAVKYRVREINNDKPFASGYVDAHGDWIYAEELGPGYKKKYREASRSLPIYTAVLRSSALQIIPEGVTGIIHKPTVTHLIADALIIFQMWVERVLSVYHLFAGRSESSWRSAPAEQQYEFEEYQSRVEAIEKIFGTRDTAEIEKIFSYLLNCRYNYTSQ